MPTAACPCEGCLVQEWGRLGHLSCEIKCGAAHSAGVGAHLPVPSHTGVKGGLGGHCQPQGQGEQSTAVPPQWGLGPTLEHPQQTQTWPMQCCCGKHLPSQSSAALPPSPCQDGISFCHFSWVFFKRDCSGYRPSWQGADELRAASTGGALSWQSPYHVPLTKTLRFPLVNSLKASMTCSFVRVFLKSRFTVPSSFLKRRESG